MYSTSQRRRFFYLTGSYNSLTPVIIPLDSAPLPRMVRDTDGDNGIFFTSLSKGRIVDRYHTSMTCLTLPRRRLRRKDFRASVQRRRMLFNHQRDFTNYDIYASRNNYQSHAIVRCDTCAFVTDVNFLNKYLTSRKYARQRELVFFARSLI